MAVLAGAVIPRMISATSRKARAVVDSTADLLTLAAARDRLSSQRIALDFDISRERLVLMKLVYDDPESLSPGSSHWEEDILYPIVSFDAADLKSVSTDGVDLDPRKWRIEFPKLERRPNISLEITTLDGASRWIVYLGGASSRAMVYDGDRPFGPLGEELDLDATQGKDQIWR